MFTGLVFPVFQNRQQEGPRRAIVGNASGDYKDEIMAKYLEDQLLDLLRSEPYRDWLGGEIEEKLGWEAFCRHPKNNQLAVCISRKLQEDGLVRVSPTPPYRIRLCR